MRAIHKLMGPIMIILALVAAIACAPPAPPPQTPSAKPAAAEPVKTGATEPAKPTPVQPATAAATPTAAAVAAKPLSPPVAVKVGTARLLSQAGLFIAKEKGYFEQEGLSVELVVFPALAQSVPAITNGELDVTSAVYTAGLFNAIARGISMKVVGHAASYTPGHGVAVFNVRKDLETKVREFRDLKGMKIATPSRGSGGDILLEKAFALGSITEADAQVVVLPAADMNPAFANKSIDIGLQAEPLSTFSAREGLSVKWKSVDQVYPNMEMAGWVYSEKFQKEKAEAAKRFMVALLRGIRDFNDVFEKNKGDRKAVLDILARNADIKDETLYKDMIMPYLDPNGAIDRKLMSNDLQWYTDKKLIEVKPDINVLIDMQYMDYALARIGKYQ